MTTTVIISIFATIIIAFPLTLMVIYFTKYPKKAIHWSEGIESIVNMAIAITFTIAFITSLIYILFSWI